MVAGRAISRRQFMKGAGGVAVGLTLSRLAPLNAKSLAAPVRYQSFEDLYRKKWRWDKVTWGTHLVDCYPGSCLFRVYVKDGVVWREEQAALYPKIEKGVPDFNPRGCNKGACFSRVTYGAERLQYPLKRVGKRGEGRWQRISWDEALDEVADAVVRAGADSGPESIIYEFGTSEGGTVHGAVPGWRLARLLGATVLDSISQTSDFNVGLYETFGKYNFVSSADDWFNADLILIWHMNPIYTRIPCAHFLTEARYKGARVVNIAPDYNASSIHADQWVPVKPGTDAALALGLAHVILRQGWENEAFIKEQTDLPLLVRLDTRRYLRESDVRTNGRDDHFYYWDRHGVGSGTAPGRLVPARLDRLENEGDPAIRGRFKARLNDGREVEVTPVFELLQERLKEFSPSVAAGICDLAPRVIEGLAEQIAKAGAVHILQGFNVSKYYHGDLMERAMALVLALTGNFGRRGTGMRGWNVSQLFPSQLLKGKPGLAGFMEVARNATKETKRLEREVDAEDWTEEMAAIALEEGEARGGAVSALPMGPVATPPVFLWYYHAGYDEVWNRVEWGDGSMKRPFKSYMETAMSEGWWDGLERPSPNREPRILFEVAGSILRRTRGGYKNLLENLWPKLDLICAVDIRMSSTARHSDIVLPAAAFYEKVDFRFPTAHVNFLTFTDKAIEPPGEAKPEWEIFTLLARKIEERARAQAVREFRDERDRSYTLSDIYKKFTFGGQITEHDGESLAADMVADTVRVGALPAGTSLGTFRKKGIVRFTGIGADALGLSLATDIKPDETLVPLKWHLEKKLPYPTLTRRIQFYIDHPWFLEAGEELPTHKDTPPMGGAAYPLVMTSGHLRWSIHSIWVTNSTLARTYRGQPTLLMNPDDAAKRGLRDNDMVEVFNDADTFKVRINVAPATRPGQVIIYHAWEPYQYPGWRPYDSTIPGMVKWLHLAGGYGHLNYRPFAWAPQQVDRAVNVEVRKA
jgi:DMSO reductase family type II enzyme molybdopterin subunit